MEDRGTPFVDEARRAERAAYEYKASQDTERLLCEAVENAIDDWGVWQFITRAGLAESLRVEFAEEIAHLRTEYEELEAEDDEDTNEEDPHA